MASASSSGGETKTGAVLDVTPSQRLVPLIDRYLDCHRPILLAGREDHHRLWVGTGGRPLARAALYGQFRRRGEELCKTRLNPHLARHRWR